MGQLSGQQMTDLRKGKRENKKKKKRRKKGERKKERGREEREGFIAGICGMVP